jgi:hypothetical protein
MHAMSDAPETDEWGLRQAALVGLAFLVVTILVRGAVELVTGLRDPWNGRGALPAFESWVHIATLTAPITFALVALVRNASVRIFRWAVGPDPIFQWQPPRRDKSVEAPGPDARG